MLPSGGIPPVTRPMSSPEGRHEGRKWWTVSFLCPLEWEEEFAAALREFSGAATCSELQKEAAVVWTSFPDEPSLHSRSRWQEGLERLAAEFCLIPPTLQIAETSEEDWLEGWKQFFSPVTIGKRLVVRPPWVTPEGWGGRRQVVIQPGLAFGTGLHATTKMCLEFLAEVISGGERILDVGAGSGVLSIAACKLGAQIAVAVDNDPLTLRECQRNCDENGVADSVVMVEGSLLGPVRGRGSTLLTTLSTSKGWDLLVCNIDETCCREVARSAGRYLVAEGGLILAGFTIEKEMGVRSAMAEGGFRLAGRRQDGPWLCFFGRASVGL